MLRGLTSTVVMEPPFWCAAVDSCPVTTVVTLSGDNGDTPGKPSASRTGTGLPGIIPALLAAKSIAPFVKQTSKKHITDLLLTQLLCCDSSKKIFLKILASKSKLNTCKKQTWLLYDQLYQLFFLMKCNFYFSWTFLILLPCSNQLHQNSLEKHPSSPPSHYL